MGKDISTKIKEKAYETGYDLCGIIEAGAFEEFNQYLDKRVEKFPRSKQLYENLYRLVDPVKKLDWAKSIIVCIRRYNKYEVPQNASKHFGKVFLFDGRVSYSKEYASKNSFESFLKEQGMRISHDEVTARWAAVKAGLGQFRKNNFVYTEFGSWVWIDTWVVDTVLDYDKESKEQMPPCPENCNRCINACPTKALSEGYAMDRGVCIAQLSFYSTELPSEEVREQMGTWIYGCDICQDVCPMNKGKWEGKKKFPELQEITELLSLEGIFSLDDHALFNVLSPRFWYISKDRLWLWKCNVLRAMANSGEKKYMSYIEEACSDKNEKVKEMALWAYKKLDGKITLE